jgi:hypothetical protein
LAVFRRLLWADFHWLGAALLAARISGRSWASGTWLGRRSDRVSELIAPGNLFATGDWMLVAA